MKRDRASTRGDDGTGRELPRRADPGDGQHSNPRKRLRRTIEELPPRARRAEARAGTGTNAGPRSKQDEAKGTSHATSHKEGQQDGRTNKGGEQGKGRRRGFEVRALDANEVRSKLLY